MCVYLKKKRQTKRGELFADICQLINFSEKATIVMSLNRILLLFCLIVLLNAINTTNSYRYHDHKENDLSLWINEQQVKILSGFSLKVFIINYGWVSPHVKDPNFSTHLPLVPSEV